MRSKEISAVLSAGILFFLSCQSLTQIARPFILSDEDEITIGQNYKKQILTDTKNYPEYKKDTAVINYINRMGQAIAAKQSDRKDIPFSFTIIDDTVVNAFALPGGPIFIYKGLLNKARNGAEVAGVIAHEIGHITMYHGANRMVQQNSVAFINDIIFGNDSTILASVVGGLASLTFLKFSREDEFQADSCAIAYSFAANYNPYGIETFFKTLKNLYGDVPFEIFSGHPTTSDRIENAGALIKKLSPVPSSDDAATLHEADYAVIKSKLKAP